VSTICQAHSAATTVFLASLFLLTIIQFFAKSNGIYFMKAPGRPSNVVSTTTLTISTTPQVKRCLEKLAARGTYGKSAAETAERLIAKAINEFVERGVFLNEADLGRRNNGVAPDETSRPSVLRIPLRCSCP